MHGLGKRLGGNATMQSARCKHRAVVSSAVHLMPDGLPGVATLFHQYLFANGAVNRIVAERFDRGGLDDVDVVNELVDRVLIGVMRLRWFDEN